MPLENGHGSGGGFGYLPGLTGELLELCSQILSPDFTIGVAEVDKRQTYESYESESFFWFKEGDAVGCSLHDSERDGGAADLVSGTVIGLAGEWSGGDAVFRGRNPSDRR